MNNEYRNYLSDVKDFPYKYMTYDQLYNYVNIFFTNGMLKTSLLAKIKSKECLDEHDENTISFDAFVNSVILREKI